MKMDCGFGPIELALRDRYHAVGRELLRPGVAARDRDGVTPEAFRELMAGLGRSGFFAIGIPRAYGGSGGDLFALAAAFEGLIEGSLDCSTAFSSVVQVGLFASTLLRFGSEAQKARWLPLVARGERVAAFGLTEPHAGADFFRATTTATLREDGRLSLSGTKWNITNAPAADVALVLATIGGAGARGLSFLVTDLNAPTVTRPAGFDLAGNRGSPTGNLIFHDHPIDAEEGIVGEPGDGVLVTRHAFATERVLAGVGIVGALRSLIGEALSAANERTAFGRRITENQYIQERFVRMRLGLEQVRLMAYRALWLLAEGRDCTLEASIAKMHGAEVLLEAARDAVQIMGNRGYRRDLYPFERLLRDALGYTIAGGTTEVQKITIWQVMQKEFRVAAQDEAGR